MLQRIALYATLGLLVDVLGVPTLSTNWWCLLGLVWASEWLGRREGYDQGLDDSLLIINRLEQRLKELHNEQQ